MHAFNAEHYVLEVKLRREKVASFDFYPFSLPAIRNFNSLDLHPAVTFIVGENGSGKSTLLEAVAVAAGFNAEGGTKNFRFQTRGSHSSLHEHLRLIKSTRRARDGFFLRAESFSMSPLRSSDSMTSLHLDRRPSTRTVAVRSMSSHTASRSLHL